MGPWMRLVPNLGSLRHLTVAALVLCVALTLCGCPGRECFAAVRCVATCGGPVVSTGCGPCGAGTFDDVRCLDAGPGDGGAVDGGALDARSDGASPDAGALDGGGGATDGSAATSCAVTSDCALRAASCCGNCGSPTLGDYVALHVDDVDGYGSAVCAAEGFPPCARCDLPTDPYLAAVCRSSACVGLDLRTEPLTACATASDCTLGPRACCDCGLLGAAETVAYNAARGSLSEYTCDVGAPPCPPCVPSFDSVMPDCVAGRCIVVALP